MTQEIRGALLRNANEFDFRYFVEMTMKALQELFQSPEFYPVILDMEHKVLRFVRMSPETYRNSVFLDLRTRQVGSSTFDIRLDDLLLAARRAPGVSKKTHYILNSAYCCSTLLARYFELLPSCFVLKEPRLLSQIAVMEHRADLPWEPVFDLCVKLLSRTYTPEQIVVMKPVDCCSLIGERLLQFNPQASITFLMTPLRQFLLSILKSGERRDWARMRIRTVFRNMGAAPQLAGVDPETLGVPQAAACLWLIHHYLYQQLAAGPHRSRVRLVNGQELADCPRQILPAILEAAGLALDCNGLAALIDHPSMRKYSKDLSRPYDASSRDRELAEVERCWAGELAQGLLWAQKHGWECESIAAACA